MIQIKWITEDGENIGIINEISSDVLSEKDDFLLDTEDSSCYTEDEIQEAGYLKENPEYNISWIESFLSDTE